MSNGNNKSSSRPYNKQKNGKGVMQVGDGSMVEWEVNSNRKPIHYEIVESQVKFLMGKVLTIVEASYPDIEQRKAVKDLIRDTFSSQLSWIYELCGYPDLSEGPRPDSLPRTR